MFTKEFAHAMRVMVGVCVMAVGLEATAGTVLYGNAPMLTDSVASFSDAGRPQYTTDDFIVSGTSDFAITQIRWWGRYFEAGDASAVTAEGTDNFYLQIYQDTGAGPAIDPWYELEIGSIARTQVATAGGVPLFEYIYALTQPLKIDGNTRYFLSVLHDNGIDDPQFGMLWSTPSSFSDPRWWRTNEASPWSATGFNTSFELVGHAIPEPATIALVGLGLLGSVVRRGPRKDNETA